MKEPRSPIGQIVRYNRQGELNGQPGVAHWWLRAIKTGDSFTVLTVTLEMYADGYVNPEVQTLINAMADPSVRASRPGKVAVQAATTEQAEPQQSAQNRKASSKPAAPSRKGTRGPKRLKDGKPRHARRRR